MPRITQKDIAEAAGVSLQTVSLVLHSRPGVSSQTRKRIRTVIEKMGYAPAASALALRGEGTRTLGVVYPGTKRGRLSASGYLEEILNGTCAAANDLRYHVLLHALSLDASAEAFLEFERQGRVDGIITVVSELSEPHLIALEQGELPVVSVQRPAKQTDVVRADNRGGTRLAVSHLVERGHRQIGYLGGNLGTYAGIERHAGFVEGCSAHGLPRNVALEAEITSSDTDGLELATEQTQRWLMSEHPPTALVCFSDFFAQGAIRAARACDKRIPQDVAIVGFNNFALASITDPPLTTIHFPAYDLGRTAALQLIGQLEQPRKTFEEIVLPVQLVIRAST
jgi:LacI family transcriptional regulator